MDFYTIIPRAFMLDDLKALKFNLSDFDVDALELHALKIVHIERNEYQTEKAKEDAEKNGRE